MPDPPWLDRVQVGTLASLAELGELRTVLTDVGGILALPVFVLDGPAI